MTGMLNLIVIGNPDYYSFFAEPCGEAFFPVSRLFESTSDSLRSKLLPLTDKTFQFLQDLPVIFMTEPEIKYDEDKEKNGYFSEIRIGKITNIRADKNNREKVLGFNYEIVSNIGNRCLSDQKEYTRELELGSFGLNRNFWAVKDIAVNEFLRILGLDEHFINVPVAGHTIAPENDENLQVITDINQYLEVILNHPQESEEDVFYRGHSDINYQLEPSLFRKDPQETTATAITSRK